MVIKHYPYFTDEETELSSIIWPRSGTGLSYRYESIQVYSIELRVTNPYIKISYYETNIFIS